MKLYFYGAAGCVSGSCYVIETNRHKIMVDCGMFQGTKYLKEKNYSPFPFDVNSIDAVLLTHAHIDHSGLLPKLHKAGYKKAIYATEATVDLCSLMLPDSGHIQEMEVERKNRKAIRAGKQLLEPIYTVEDANKTLALFKSCKYDVPLKINDEFIITFKDAGHIMGSAIIEVIVKTSSGDTKIVFSGDLGRKNQNIINDPTSIQEADYLLLETTYGNRLHAENKDRKELLAQAITKTFHKGGNVIIPAFAVERTQDLLYDINSLIEDGTIKGEDIYIDSPLAIGATEVFSKHIETFDKETRDFYDKKGYLPFLPKTVKYSKTADESRQLNIMPGPKIIISANGMAEAGRIRHHLRHNLWRKESSVIFVGYQAEGSLGRRLVEGEKKVRVLGEDIAVNSDIYFIDAYSAHADYNDSLAWLSNFSKLPKTLFLVHGEQAAADNFAKLVKDKFGISTETPGLSDYYDFDTSQLVRSPESVHFAEVKKDVQIQSLDEAFAAAERIRNFLAKIVNKKFNAQQFKNVNLELNTVTRFLNKLKKEAKK